MKPTDEEIRAKSIELFGPESDHLANAQEMAEWARDESNTEYHKSMKNIVQVGLKTTIEIHCETGQEILAHLSVIRKTLKKQLKKSGGDIPDGLDVRFEDDNCYGNHVVEIDPEFS